ncbi:MAG: metalloregulator ArsR/SmtB family transcription factor [Dehalococcoidia bacterium]|jgi:ArsR family transcriptional regulator
MMTHIYYHPTGTAPAVFEAGLTPYLRLLGDENRLRIFSLLTKAELCVCEVEDATGLSQSLVSNHLAALRRAGLVEGRRDDEDGRWIFYRANAQVAAALRESLCVLLDVQASSGDRRRAEQVCRLRQREVT